MREVSREMYSPCRYYNDRSGEEIITEKRKPYLLFAFFSLVFPSFFHTSRTLVCFFFLSFFFHAPRGRWGCVCRCVCVCVYVLGMCMDKKREGEGEGERGDGQTTARYNAFHRLNFPWISTIFYFCSLVRPISLNRSNPSLLFLPYPSLVL